jgi:drug/metabolite transporter (DMT)-like permease
VSQEIPSTSKLVLYLLVGMGTFALAPILVRFAGDVHPVTLAVIRTVTAVLLLTPFWLKQRMSQTIEPWAKKDQWLSVAAGSFLALHFLCWFYALAYTSVASASVLVTIHPIILIVVESVLRTNRFKLLTWIGVIVAFSGSVLLALMDSDAAVPTPNAPLGNSLAILAAVFFVFYILLSRKLRLKARWLDFVFRVYASTAVTCVVVFFLLGLSFTASLAAIICGILLAIGPQIAGHGSLNYSVKFVSPTLLATLILAEPVFAIFLAAFLFSEVPTFIEISAMSTILFGIILTWFGGQKKR